MASGSQRDDILHQMFAVSSSLATRRLFLRHLRDSLR
jgi:hypothetical protein